MGNCAIDVIGVIVANHLTDEDLPPEKQVVQDGCLDNLEKHIFNSNPLIRSKVLQTWEKLYCAGAIPLSRQTRLLKVFNLRLEDESATQQEQVLQLLRIVLQNNSFTSKV